MIVEREPGEYGTIYLSRDVNTEPENPIGTIVRLHRITPEELHDLQAASERYLNALQQHNLTLVPGVAQELRDEALRQYTRWKNDFHRRLALYTRRSWHRMPPHLRDMQILIQVAPPTWANFGEYTRLLQPEPSDQ